MSKPAEEYSEEWHACCQAVENECKYKMFETKDIVCTFMKHCILAEKCDWFLLEIEFTEIKQEFLNILYELYEKRKPNCVKFVFDLSEEGAGTYFGTTMLIIPTKHLSWLKITDLFCFTALTAIKSYENLNFEALACVEDLCSWLTAYIDLFVIDWIKRQDGGWLNIANLYRELFSVSRENRPIYSPRTHLELIRRAWGKFQRFQKLMFQN